MSFAETLKQLTDVVPVPAIEYRHEENSSSCPDPIFDLKSSQMPEVDEIEDLGEWSVATAGAGDDFSLDSGSRFAAEESSQSSSHVNDVDTKTTEISESSNNHIPPDVEEQSHENEIQMSSQDAQAEERMQDHPAEESSVSLEGGIGPLTDEEDYGNDLPMERETVQHKEKLSDEGGFLTITLDDDDDY